MEIQLKKTTKIIHQVQTIKKIKYKNKYFYSNTHNKTIFFVIFSFFAEKTVLPTIQAEKCSLKGKIIIF